MNWISFNERSVQSAISKNIATPNIADLYLRTAAYYYEKFTF